MPRSASTPSNCACSKNATAASSEPAQRCRKRASEAVRANNVARANAVAELRRRILAEVNAAAVVVDERTLLDGLPDGDIAAAAAAATARGLTGKWVLPLQNTTQQPALAYLRHRGMRERLFKASVSRNASGANDTTALLMQMAQLRAERATLLGFDDHAAYTLDDTMAKTAENALGLMRRMVPATAARAREEASRLEARLRMDVPGATLEPWDWQYYAEQVRRADYAVDESEVRRVLRARSCAAGRRLLCRNAAVRHHVPGADRHPRLSPGCARVRGRPTPTARVLDSCISTTLLVRASAAAPG